MNKIKFFKLDGLQVGKGLCTVNFLLKSEAMEEKKCQDLITIPLLSDAYRIRNDGGELLFLFSNSYADRNDYKEWFNRLLDLTQKKCVMMGKSDKHGKGFSVKEQLLILIWILQMSFVKCKLKEKLIYCNYMICGLRNILVLKEQIKKYDIKSLITVSDMHIADYFMIWYCNKSDIRTITLQHGYFNISKYLEKELFRLSPSRYFLTYGPYAKKLGMKVGVPEKKLIPLGMPQCIGKSKLSSRSMKYDKKKFLVVLDTDENHLYNVQMIEICNQFAEQADMRFDVKFHPSASKLHRKEYVQKVSGQGELLEQQYASKDDLFSKYFFGIFHETTMIFEAIYNLFPLCIYTSGEIIYKELKLPYFSTADELIEIKDSLGKDEDRLKELREYVCGEGNIDLNYTNFFSNLYRC